MPNFKIKAYIGEVPEGGCVPVFIIASPDQEGENFYDTLTEAKECLLAQIKASGRSGWEQRLESAYIKKLTLKKLFAEHFAYLKYTEDIAETCECTGNFLSDRGCEIDYPEASEIVKA